MLAAALLCLPTFVEAAPVPGTYTVTISESSTLLNALGTPNEDAVAMAEACVAPHIKVQRRNMPAILIENDAASGGDLSTFTIEIKENGFVFGNTLASYSNFVMPVPDPNSSVVIDSTSISPDGRLLTVNFSNFAPGEKTIFRVDIDPDGSDPNAFKYPDFRQVLGGMGPAGEVGLNAVGETSGVFTMGNMSTPTASTPLPLAMPNTNGPPGPPVINQMIDNHINPDPVVTVTSTATAIPEPTAAGIAGVALALLAGLRRRV